MMENLYEKTIRVQSIYQGKIVQLDLEEVELPNGVHTKRELIRHPGAVAILPITSTGKILLIRQFRKACEEVLWEIPAGKIEKGEKPEETAIRELQEETGYEPASLQKLYTFYTSPGFADEKIELFLASELQKKPMPPDEDEFIELVEVEWAKVEQLLEAGEIRDAKTLIALQYWRLSTITK